MGNIACNPSPGVVDELFAVSRNASMLPDVTLDPTLATYLSLDSAAALKQHYASLEATLTTPQVSAFRHDLASTFGEGGRVRSGGVGVVALALALLFEALALQAAGGRAMAEDPIRRIFGADHTSEVGPIVSEYLKLVPRVVGNAGRMRELTERCEGLLTRELADRYDDMTSEGYPLSPSVKQWLNGAALHLHMRVHLVRLRAAQQGSALSLAVSYRSGLPVLIQKYSEHLRRTIREIPAQPGSPGLLSLEPLLNITHTVVHRPCESAAVAEQLAARIQELQDLQHSMEFFYKAEADMDELLLQKDDFILRAVT